MDKIDRRVRIDSSNEVKRAKKDTRIFDKLDELVGGYNKLERKIERICDMIDNICSR